MDFDQKKFLLNLATNTFDYIGSIASFLVISVPIFNGNYDHLKPSEISKMISENAFVCMYLIYQVNLNKSMYYPFEYDAIWMIFSFPS